MSLVDGQRALAPRGASRAFALALTMASVLGMLPPAVDPDGTRHWLYPSTSVQSAAWGNDQMCVLVNGKLRCFGNLGACVVPRDTGGTDFRTLVSSDRALCGLTREGSLVCWGEPWPARGDAWVPR